MKWLSVILVVTQSCKNITGPIELEFFRDISLKLLKSSFLNTSPFFVKQVIKFLDENPRNAEKRHVTQ